MGTGVDIARFAAAAYDVPGQAAWTARAGGRYVLVTGGLAADDGCLDLLEAHAVLLQEQAGLAEVRVVVAGAGTHDDGLVAFEQRAAELGTSPLLLGPVREQEYPALVAGASAFGYLPTSGGSCTEALEALAAGVPVIARDLPEIRAVLRDVVVYGDTALSIADALVDVLTDPPEPGPGVALAATCAERWAETGPDGRPEDGLEDGVVEEQPDRGDGRQE